MRSKIRELFVTVCAVLGLVGALGAHPGASVTEASFEPEVVPPEAAPATFDDIIDRLRSVIAERADEIAATGSWYSEVALYNKNRSEAATFRITDDGIVDPDQADDLKEFFSCRRTGRKRAVHPGVLAMLVDVAKRFEGKTIEVISGYRAKPYGVKGSKHFVGRAIDFRVRGVPLRVVRDYVWRHHHAVGVGYYPHHGFVHMDYRPDQAEAAWTSGRTSKRYRKNPYWARKARARQL